MKNQETHTTPAAHAAAAPITVHSEQSTNNFLLLMVASLGTYQIYWGWKAWETVEKVDPKQRHTAIRGFFLPLTGFWLYPEMLRHAKKVGYPKSYVPLLLAVLFLIVNMGTDAKSDGTHSAIVILILAALSALLAGLLLLPLREARTYLMTHHKPQIAEPAPSEPLKFFIIAIWVIILAAAVWAN